MKCPRWVLDTNVLVAASRSRSGASFELLCRFGRGQFVLLLSVPLVLEYEAVMKRPEQLLASGQSPAQIGDMLDELCRQAEPVDLHFMWRPQTRDPADEMVLDTAVNGSADALVTLNARDFAAAASFGLPVIAPAQAVGFLRRGD